MPAIKAQSFRLPTPTVMLGTKPQEHFQVGVGGCESIEIRDNGTAVILTKGNDALYVLPSGATALVQEGKK